ncbi:hypothetical protein BDY24DRAFT_399018 [Mrakia frigida]|uniref:uncharacterized protein n=1 Tax=Mrakia frigida TaxID=29902 RepID=UPI003FCC07BB
MSVAAPRTKTIAIIGGSYAAAGAVNIFNSLLPSLQKKLGDEKVRIVLVERNSHANHLYVFPRFAVVPNHSHKAFIPYSGIFGPDSASLPHLVLHASALELKKNSVKLNRSFPSSLGLKFHEEKENFTGEDDVLEFDYCILCTGGQLAESMNTWQERTHIPSHTPTPLGDDSKYGGTKKEGIAFLKKRQEEIKAAKNIVVVGGGALGIQTATDIASFYGPGAKNVTLLHSRDRMMPLFPKSLHDEAVKQVDLLGINLILGERLVSCQIVDGAVKTSTGRELECDLLMFCTGQKPNSGLVGRLLPSSIESETGRIKVKPTMQIEVELPEECLSDRVKRLSVLDSKSSSEWDHIFAVGDCANVKEIKAGNRAWGQAIVAARNILRLIYQAASPPIVEVKKEGEEESTFDASSPLEDHVLNAPGIKMTLGLKAGVVASAGKGTVAANEHGVEDNHAASMWSLYSAAQDDLHA